MNRNQVQLIGYVGKHLAAATVANGSRRVAIRMATHYQRCKTGVENTDTTVWHDVIAWDHMAELAERSFVKGSKIMVEGPLDYRVFTGRDGIKRKQVRIIARTLVNLDR